jgi:glucose-6-phosphate dehydrogenase assembly protein OpcA
VIEIRPASWPRQAGERIAYWKDRFAIAKDNPDQIVKVGPYTKWSISTARTQAGATRRQLGWDSYNVQREGLYVLIKYVEAPSGD